jgi:phage-related tail fiber protein
MASTLKHLRSSTANKRPTASGLADGQIAINTASGTPAMFFKDSNGGVVKVGPAHVGATAPNATPAGSAGNSLGEQWLDNSGGGYRAKYWDGTAWRSPVITNADIGASAAIALSKLATGALPSGITVNSSNISDLSIVNADISASAAIALSKLATGALPSGITISSNNIVNSTIVDADINASAAIGLSKLATGALPAGITVASVNIVDETIVNGDISASAAIADTKLATISTANKVSVSAINIDGATDIGAALADADLFVVDDGGAGANRKAAATRISDYVFGKVSGDLTIATTGSATLANSGVGAGTYRSVAVDSKGRVTAGTNPTTFSGYGISDTSANLAAAITDETGSGSLVFATSPALAGTPTAPTAAAGTNTTQIATTAFVSTAVDAARQGLTVKQSCRAATTANITLSGLQTVDGIVLVASDRVLVKNQSTASQNGIYLVAPGAWTRATDFDAASDLTDGAFTFIEEGTVNADSGWVLTTDGAIVVGTTSLTFAQFSGAGQITAGDGLSKSGNTLSVATGGITSGMIANGSIVNEDISNSAAIALSKLATGALPSGITIASANIVDGTIVNADISASAAIALSKLATGALPSGITISSSNIVDGTIVNADINASAAIAGTKVAPDFGAQNVVTTGTIRSGGLVANNATYDGAVTTGSTDGCAFISQNQLRISNNESPCGLLRRRGTDGITLQFYRDTTAVGSISVTTTATAYNTSSDYRLKENIVDLNGAIDRLKALPVHRFNFITDPDTTVDGFIAHEAAAVVPEAVTGTKDEEDEEGNPVYQGIDQSKIVPLLTAALKETIDRIEQLEQQLTQQ